MANRYRNLIYSTAEYTHSYNGFRGVELNGSGATSSTSRLAYAENMYKDYDGDGADVIESVPGFRRLIRYEEVIHGLYHQRTGSGEDYLIIHSNDNLRRYPMSAVSADTLSSVSPIASLADADSVGVCYGKHFYLLDGEGITRVSADGEVKRVSASDDTAYVPTLFINSSEAEARNLLTDSFKEEYRLTDPSIYHHFTSGLKYRIIDHENRYCAVCGIDEGVSGAIYVPSSVFLFDTEYRVSEIDSYAFKGNTGITEAYVGEGVTRIRPFAFYQCENLTTLVLPDSLEVIESSAFADCVRLVTVYLGEGLKELGISPFSYTVSLSEINYALSEDQYSLISNTDSLSAKTVIYNSSYEAIRLSLPVCSDASEITSVSVDGAAAEYEVIRDGGKITHVTLDFPTAADATGVRVLIEGSLNPLLSDFSTGGEGIGGYEAITQCRVAEIFDGRLFLSGNPSLPCTVFYTSRTEASENGALYFGAHNYFNDGIGEYAVKSLLAVRDKLAVFKEGDDGSGSIFYHYSSPEDAPTLSAIYPTAYVHSGICATGESLSFLDDPVFLSSEGLSALERENINYQRSIACRSHNVNYKLLKEDLSKANLCVWKGYLAVCVNGSIYLADSRATFKHPTGNVEYEWFLLTGIGTYTGDKTVYRYSDTPYSTHEVHPSAVGDICQAAIVYKTVDSEGVTHYFSFEKGKRYSLVITDQKQNGVFSPAVKFVSCADKLIFATENTDICVFNNDRRGVPPERVSSDSEFDAEQYALEMGNKLHPDFYDFAGHAAVYTVKTPLDDCGIPHLTKSTVKKSLIVKARAYIDHAIKCSVITDKSDEYEVASIPENNVSFSDFFFDANLWSEGKYVSTALPEKAKAWIEKQLSLTANEFRCPISLYSVTYRYTIKGKIKNNS